MPIAVTLLTGAKIKSRCAGVTGITVLQTMGESEVNGFIDVYAEAMNLWHRALELKCSISC